MATACLPGLLFSLRLVWNGPQRNASYFIEIDRMAWTES